MSKYGGWRMHVGVGSSPIRSTGSSASAFVLWAIGPSNILVCISYQNSS